MTIDTSKFGVVKIDDEKLLMFQNGILGFEECKRYTIIRIEENMPFYWLQAVDNKDISLPCINPYEIMPSYNPQIELAVLDGLGVENDIDLLVLATVMVPLDPTCATANLAAPIIINTANNKGVQFVMQNSDYSLHHSVFSAKGDAENADTFKEAK